FAFEALCFCAAAALFWWLCRGCAFSDWDDISHWGKALKFMFYEGGLYTSPSYTGNFASYPPASAVLQYIIIKTCGFGFREDVALFANVMWVCAMLVYPLKCFKINKRPIRVIIGILFMMSAVFIIPEFYKKAGVDVLLGILMAFLLLTEFLPQRDKTDIILQITGCFCLALLKNSGVGLALLVALIIFIHQLWLLHEQANLKPIKQKLLQYFIAALPMLAVFAAKISWQAHLNFQGITQRWQSKASPISLLWEMFTGAAPQYRYDVARLFADSIVHVKNYGVTFSFPFIGWIILCGIIMAFAVIITQRAERKNLIFATISVISSAAVFVLSLLYTYVILFDKNEALELASISRYLNTCVMLLMMFSLCVFAVALYNADKRGLFAALPVTFICFGCLCNVRYIKDVIVNAPIYAAQTNHDRYLSRYAASRIAKIDEENPKLYLITANDAGISQLRIEFDLMPKTLPAQSSIIATDEFLSDPWVKHCTWQEWSRELYEKYDYVYIFCPETQYVREFLPVFEDESQVVVDRLFSVTKKPDGTASLKCLD
ncbi:MAG: hypothetical protein RR087_08420, partial [Oscillospiraceae bacterium]